MKQPLTLTLALITVMAVLLTGIVMMRSCDQDKQIDEYSSFHRDPTKVVAAKEAKIDTELDEMWDSVGWLGHEVTIDGEIGHSYVETAWAIGSDKTFTYYLTCFHGPLVTGRDNLTIGYWDKTSWQFARAEMLGFLGRFEGDLAIMAVKTSDLRRVVKPLKVAKEQTFALGDEVLIGGVQHYGGPAYVTVGLIKMVNMNKPEFVIKGWAWYGFSGGPIRLRKTGEVIGFVRAATEMHRADASESICGDYTLIHKLLKRYALEDIAK